MSRFGVCLLIPILFGCQGSEPVLPRPVTAIKVDDPGVPPPATIQATPIALVHKGEVTVGMTPEAAFKVFQDERSGGFETEDLPPGFKEPYRARSWEDGQHGFGVITYNGRVVAAMYQVEKESLDDFNSFVTLHRDRLPDVEERSVPGRRVNYYFWDMGKQRLMICGISAGADQVRLTACIGDAKVLDNLGVSYDQAKRDEVAIDGAIDISDHRPKGSAK